MDAPVTLTPEAADHIRGLMTRHGWNGAHGLRFGLQDGGCSGFTYLVDVEEKPDDDDLVFESNGVRVFVHPLHLPFVEGTIIGYKIARFEEGFDIQNPHAKRHCGCGDSFDVG